MKKNKKKFGSSLVDGVSTLPIVGFLLSKSFAIIFSMLTSPFMLISIGSAGYVFKDYASIDGIKLIATVNKSNSWNKFAQCAVTHRSVDLVKMQTCLTDKNQGADLGEAIKAFEAVAATQSKQMESIEGNQSGSQKNQNGNNENDAQKSMLTQLANAFAKSTESK